MSPYRWVFSGYTANTSLSLWFNQQGIEYTDYRNRDKYTHNYITEVAYFTCMTDVDIIQVEHFHASSTL